MSYHSKIVAHFGKDLTTLLGPAANRRPWASLTHQEQKKILDRIPGYVNTRSLGKHPSLVDVVIFCFNKLANLGLDNPLLGIGLPEYKDLTHAATSIGVPAMNYDHNLLHSVDSLFKNADKQRDVFLRHIFEDIIFRFNPGLIFPGVGRLDSKNRLFVNDAQHRILACIMLGIEYVPVSYIESDDDYWDVAQYAAINIHSLTASEFDKYRIRVQRHMAATAAGIMLDPEDELSFELHDLFVNLGVTVAEKGDNGGQGNSLVLNSIGNMIKYRKDYKKDFFTRATTLNARMFTTCKFQTANSWGLMEFLKAQTTTEEASVVDYAIMGALKQRWAKDNAGNRLHSNIKEAYKKTFDVNVNDSRVPEPVIIAEGIYQVCKKYAPHIDWKSPWPVGAEVFIFPVV